MASDLITIPEFLRITKLSGSDLLTMLQNGELQFTAGPTRELLIDLAQMTPKQLAHRSTTTAAHLSEEQKELIEEIVASEILNAIDDIVDEASDLAQRWSGNKTD